MSRKKHDPKKNNFRKNVGYNKNVSICDETFYNITTFEMPSSNLR